MTKKHSAALIRASNRGSRCLKCLAWYDEEMRCECQDTARIAELRKEEKE